MLNISALVRLINSIINLEIFTNGAEVCKLVREYDKHNRSQGFDLKAGILNLNKKGNPG